MGKKHQIADVERRETNSEVPLAALPPMSLDRFQELTGWSGSTTWRMRKRGWLRTVVICGRHYVPRSAIVELNERAQRGELSGTLLNPFTARHAASKKRQ